VVVAAGYFVRLLRRVAVGLDRWDALPGLITTQAGLVSSVAAIHDQVVPDPADPENRRKPPLHERVARLEAEAIALREELEAHTAQDGENFGTLHSQLEELGANGGR
jgi:hypothetical protein